MLIFISVFCLFINLTLFTFLMLELSVTPIICVIWWFGLWFCVLPVLMKSKMVTSWWLYAVFSLFGNTKTIWIYVCPCLVKLTDDGNMIHLMVDFHFDKIVMMQIDYDEKWNWRGESFLVLSSFFWLLVWLGAVRHLLLLIVISQKSHNPHISIGKWVMERIL